MTRPTPTNPQRPLPLPQPTGMRSRRRRHIQLLHGVRAAAFLMVLASLGDLLRTAAVREEPAAAVWDWIAVGGAFGVILAAEIIRRHVHPQHRRSPWHPRPEESFAPGVTNVGDATTYR